MNMNDKENETGWWNGYRVLGVGLCMVAAGLLFRNINSPEGICLNAITAGLIFFAGVYCLREGVEAD